MKKKSSFDEINNKAVSPLFSEFFGKKRVEGDFGVEIESETKKDINIPRFKYWIPKGDGSLRNYGIEYIFAKPLSYNDSILALDEIKDWFAKIELIQSNYASIHVHINVTDLTVEQFVSILTTLYLLEDNLALYSGPQRDGNLFCLKEKNTKRIFPIIKDAFTSGNNGESIKRKFMNVVTADRFKYSAINLTNLFTLGTVEIRLHGCEYNVDNIKTWVNILYGIKQCAMKHTPSEILNSFVSNYDKFMRDVFQSLNKVINLPVEEVNRLKTAVYVSELVYLRDWTKLQVSPKNKLDRLKKPIEDLDPISYIPNLINDQRITIVDAQTPQWLQQNRVTRVIRDVGIGAPTTTDRVFGEGNF